MTFVVLIDTPEVRILRVVLEPGGVRRVPAHEDVTFHLLMPPNGVLEVSADKELVEATGTAPVTIMEMFVKPPQSPQR